MTRAKGLFIVIEGLDGSGKSKISEWLANNLPKHLSVKIKQTYEPHDPSCAGDFIRKVLRHQIVNVSPTSLALAFAANRADHLDREIMPFLLESETNIVICHRYYLSGLTYQMSTSMSIEILANLNQFAITPDITFFLDANASVCYERMEDRNLPKELFESNLEELRHKYYEAINFLRKKGDFIVEIDANRSFDEVTAQLLKVLLIHLRSFPNQHNKTV